jgi:hypothetical protein
VAEIPPRPQFSQKAVRPEAAAAHHEQSEIHDADAIAMPVQECCEREEPDGIHLEHRRRGDDVADRPIPDRSLAEVEHAGRVDQNHVGLHPFTMRCSRPRGGDVRHGGV